MAGPRNTRVDRLVAMGPTARTRPTRLGFLALPPLVGAYGENQTRIGPMCGRFSQSERLDRLAEWFGADSDDDLPAGNYNVAPTDPIRIVLQQGEARKVVAADWGFRPFWRGRPEKREPGWINARAETVLDSPAFGPALRQHRCVIPADAFYEWDRRHRPPQPYAIGPADEGGMLALAGLWAQTRPGEPTTVAILTTEPNRMMESLHHRMPVILHPDNVDAWLATDAAMRRAGASPRRRARGGASRLASQHGGQQGWKQRPEPARAGG